MKLPKVTNHVFNDEEYAVVFGDIKENTSAEDLAATQKNCNIENADDILALTDDRGTENQTILISDKIKSSKELLRVLLDESLHACSSELDNDTVHIYATDISNFLWKCGFRYRNAS
jgi:hypothetical protein